MHHVGKQARKKKGKKTLCDPFIYNHSGVDLVLLSAPARELKRSSNSYYKAINLWVLTYASPLAIWFLYRGMTVRLAALVPVLIRCDCHLPVDDSTASQWQHPGGCPCPGHRLQQSWGSRLLHLPAVENDFVLGALAAFTHSLR